MLENTYRGTRIGSLSYGFPALDEPNGFPSDAGILGVGARNVKPLPPSRGGSHLPLNPRSRERKGAVYSDALYDCIADLASAISHVDPVTFAGPRIEDLLGRVGRHFQADHVRLYSQHRGRATSYVWTPDGSDAFAEVKQPPTPWTEAKLLAGVTLRMSRLSELPPEAQGEAKMLQAAGIQSFVCRMLFPGAKVSAGISVSSQHEREWTDAEVDELQILGGMVAAAALRDVAEAAAIRSKALFEGASRDLNDTLLHWSPDRRVRFLNEAGRDQLGLGEALLDDGDVFELVPSSEGPSFARALTDLTVAAPILTPEDFASAGPNSCSWTHRGFFDRAGRLELIQSSRGGPRSQPAANSQRSDHCLLLLSSLSDLLVEAEAVDSKQEIEEWLAGICDGYEFVWTSVWLRDSDSERLTLAFASSALSALSAEDVRDSSWLSERVMANEPTVIEGLDELPAGAEERDRCLQFGVSSLVLCPFVVGGRVVGGCVFSRAHQGPWDADVVSELSLLSQALSHYMQFTRLGQTIRNLDADLNRAEQAGSVGRWSFDLSTNVVALSDTLRSLLGLGSETFSRAELVTLLRFGHGEEYEELIAIAQRENGPAESGILHLQSRDGRKLHVVLVLEIERGDDGSLQRTFGTLQDVSALVAAQAALAEAHAEVIVLKNARPAIMRTGMDKDRGAGDPDEIIGECEAITDCLTQVRQVAPTELTVLIRGETGTGKQLIANAIHAQSSRSAKLMVHVNCAALPASLIESELFGHEKGAFTGAHARRIGRFELAEGSTLFLDEIGDLDLALQAKLLHVLEAGQLERVGSSRPLRVDVRVVAATHRDLELAIANGTFRADLYYRLNAFSISLPALIDRTGDIPAIASHFAAKHSRLSGRSPISLAPSALRLLGEQPWPGNVRQLEGVIARSIVVCDRSELEATDLRLGPVVAAQSGRGSETRKEKGSLRDLEHRHILETLEKSGWVVEGKSGAAAAIGMKPSTLRSRMKNLGIHRSPE